MFGKATLSMITAMIPPEKMKGFLVDNIDSIINFIYEKASNNTELQENEYKLFLSLYNEDGKYYALAYTVNKEFIPVRKIAMYDLKEELKNMDAEGLINSITGNE